MTVKYILDKIYGRTQTVLGLAARNDRSGIRICPHQMADRSTRRILQSLARYKPEILFSKLNSQNLDRMRFHGGQKTARPSKKNGSWLPKFFDNHKNNVHTLSSQKMTDGEIPYPMILELEQ